MQNLTLTWQSAGAASVALYAGAVAVKRSPRVRRAAPAFREAGTLLALFALWQLVGRLSIVGTNHAFDRALWIHHAELALGLPDEAAVQRAALPHEWLVVAANYYYAVMHFAVMIGLLLWVFVRHRDRYPWLRTTVVFTTLACLIVQFVPVAPPRMLATEGFVDVAVAYGQSVYGTGVGGVVPDQLSAMPSVHVAWCVIVAVAVIVIAESPWRWLVLCHPLATIAVVTVTANHFWADGLVALVLLLAVYLVQYAAAGPSAEAAGPAGSGPGVRPLPAREGGRQR